MNRIAHGVCALAPDLVAGGTLAAGAQARYRFGVVAKREQCWVGGCRVGWSALGCLALVAVLACSERDESSAAGGAGGTVGGGASGGVGGGVGGAAGQVGVACPGAVEPSLVSDVPDAVALDPTAYQGGSVPQLDLDGPDPGFTYNDPHVLKVADQFWMYASSTVGFDFPVRLYRLVSSDGVSWVRDPAEPVLGPAPPGRWDSGGDETPAVVFFAGRYHLFYTTYAFEIDDPRHAVSDFRIGHATSCDGVAWQREPDPVVAPSGEDSDPFNDWYAFIVGEPGPVVYQGELYLYFTAVGVSVAQGTSLQVIGVATTADGTNWAPPQIALAPDQAQYPRVIDPGPPIDGWVGYSTPSAMVLNDEVHLFVDVARDPDEQSWRQIRLHHAVSADGFSYWRQDAEPIASAGDFPWAVDEIRSPNPIVDGTTLRLYFAGHELDGTAPEHFAIGMMTVELVP